MQYKKALSLSILSLVLVGSAFGGFASVAHGEGNASAGNNFIRQNQLADQKNDPRNLGDNDDNQNGIVGTVTAVDGSSIMVKSNRDGVTYTVDAANAKFEEGRGTTITIANVSLGDTVTVQGSINGTLVTATSIVDGASTVKVSQGFFYRCGQFFRHLFGGRGN